MVRDMVGVQSPMGNLPRNYGFINTMGDLFDEIFDSFFDDTTQSIGRYPSYNIVEKNNGYYQIQFAVPGYSEDELSLDLSDDYLTIRGNKKKEDNDEKQKFVKKGIYLENFERSIRIDDTIKVDGAILENGVLSVNLRKEEPQKNTRKIEINSSGNNTKKIDSS